MKILVDMNLSPSWIELFRSAGWHAEHWSTIGRGDAADTEVLEWAVKNGYIILTHDLDFGALLATRRLRAPSIIQLRGQETSPATIGPLIVSAIRQLRSELDEGALVSVDPRRARARILPLSLY